MPISRRTLLKGCSIAAAAYGTGLALPAARRAFADAPAELVAHEGSALLADGRPTSAVMTYGLGGAGDGVPPVLRMRKGEEFAARLVNRLQERDYLRRERSASDGRKQALHITAAGVEALAEAKRCIAEHEAWLKARFTPAETEKLVEMLARIHE